MLNINGNVINPTGTLADELKDLVSKSKAAFEKEINDYVEEAYKFVVKELKEAAALGETTKTFEWEERRQKFEKKDYSDDPTITYHLTYPGPDKAIAIERLVTKLKDDPNRLNVGLNPDYKNREGTFLFTVDWSETK